MGKLYSLIPVAAIAALLSSCCEPGHRDSQPAIAPALFAETSAFDMDIVRSRTLPKGVYDSGYYPIYTFGVANTGTADDDFTMKIVYNSALVTGAEIDITKHVKAGDTVLFQTPVSPPNANTLSATYFYPNLRSDDTNPLMTHAYLAFFQPIADSTEIHLMRPQVSIFYGAIDNGPEACNTPTSVYSVSIDRLPKR